MKIIFDKNRPIIECNYEEGMKIIREFLLDSKKTSNIRKKGSGKYKHKSKVTDQEKILIKKIFENYPQRSIRSVAKELDLTEDQIRYWRDHGKTTKISL